MPSHENLRLVRLDEDDTHTLSMERRRAPRHAVQGHVTALQTSLEVSGQRNRICSLQMLNLSTTGLGALTQEPIALDTPITVFFPPHGPERGFDMTGRVVRCVPRQNQHEVGVRFEQRAAA